jgi:hypothetical protein
MSKKVNAEKAIRTLQNKGVKFMIDNSIDLSKAKNLGNKSFGYLSYFIQLGFRVVGIHSMRKTDGAYYPSNDSEGGKKPKPVVLVQGERKWHANADLVREKCSEAVQLLELNRLQEKTNNAFLYHKTKAEKVLLKGMKKEILPFTNTTLWSSEYIPKDIPLNKSKR